jgi:hypothetical protein
MDELEVIQRLGITISPTICKKIEDKSKRNIIRTLNILNEFDEIKIITIPMKQTERRLYMTHEIYRNLFEEKR